MSDALILRLTDLTKSFGGVMAVNDVSFDVAAGSIVGLIGPNGAGKTTVFNLITGNYRPDKGQILFNGKNIVNLRTNRIVSLGVARTFQTIRLFQNMSVLENVLAGCHCRMRSGVLGAMLRLPSQKREERQALQTAVEELEFVGLKAHLDQAAKNLSYGNQRLLEIARALATKPRFLILDEPAGGMNDNETQALVNLIAQIRDRGVTVLLIEHDMNLVMRICEKLVVLEYGIKIAEGAPEEIQKDQLVIKAYLGVAEEDEDEGF
jgi:branched-chain amino acid transport system ATP-binding protein